MNKWWKAGLLGAAAIGATVMSGGTAAPLLGMLAGEGAAAGAAGAGAAGAAGAGAAGAAGATAAGAAGAAGAGAAGGAGLLAGETAGAGAGLLGGEAAAGAAGTAGAGTGALAYTTPSVTSGLLGGGELSGSLAGTDAAYGSAQALAAAPEVGAPTFMEQAGTYGGQAGKAASTYASVNSAVGGNPPPRQAPPPQPVFQGDAPPITPQGPSGPMMGAQDTPFMRLLMDQKMRQRGGGMLG